MSIKLPVSELEVTLKKSLKARDRMSWQEEILKGGEISYNEQGKAQLTKITGVKSEYLLTSLYVESVFKVEKKDGEEPSRTKLDITDMFEFCLDLDEADYDVLKEEVEKQKATLASLKKN